MNHQQDPAASAEECDCAPSAAERRRLWPALNRRQALGVGALGALALGVGTGASFGISAAYAASYPSWEDVQAAKDNESAKAGEISRIEGLIVELNQRVAETQAAAEAAASEFFAAQQAAFAAARRADDLQAQADEQAGIADEAARKAAQVAAKLYRNGGDDTSLQLFFSGSAAGADELLSRLGQMDRLLEHNQSVYDKAVAARNAAQLLSDQAEVARAERDRLQQLAEEKMHAAQAAADAAQAALALQEEHLATLEAQLAALQDETVRTVAAYEEGVAERRRQEELRRQQEEEERRRRAEEAAAAESNNGGGGGGGGGGGVATGSGWARPHGGWRSDSYGWRPQTCTSGYCSSSFHEGVDLANGCWAPIYAASAGRVDVAWYNGGYGNYIRIQHGGGVATGYAHISGGGYAVGTGQWVEAGQVIAYAGNTGNSFGCHLHFEVYVNGRTVNPDPFMADRGVWL